MSVFFVSRFGNLLKVLLLLATVSYSPGSLARKPGNTGGGISDEKEWSFATTPAENKSIAEAQEQPEKGKIKTQDEASQFATSYRATKYHGQVIAKLEELTKPLIAKENVGVINGYLYNVSPAGEPANISPDASFFQKHSLAFCSPLSGFETKVFKNCRADMPLLLQHADVKPLILSSDRFNADSIALVKNWIRNFGVSPVAPETPDYIKFPELLDKISNKKAYIKRLRRQVWGGVAADSLNKMLARRIPVSDDKQAPSLASAVNLEVEGRFLNSSWQEGVATANDQLDVQKEQLRVLALISYQLNDLNSRVEQLQLLNASNMTLLANQQEYMERLAQKLNQE